MSNDEHEESDLIVIPFNAEKGTIINARDLLINEGIINDNNKKEASKMSSILAKVQSKMGTVCPGYDEGDNFIDDSEVINNTNVSHVLDPNSFRVVLSFATAAPAKQTTPSKSRSEEVLHETTPVSDELVPYIEAIRQVTFSSINEVLEKIHSGSQKEKDQKIHLTNEMIDAIGKCIDEKVRIETEKLDAPPSKKKADGWRRDIVNLIFQQCFTVKEYTLISSTRVLQNAYKKYNERKTPKQEAGDQNNSNTANATPSNAAPPQENPAPNENNDEKEPEESLTELPPQ
ncbi:hypothetical protein TRFO_08294 [Tritrichomonas foetus]|uniref:Uncharacterized protein n=1 Tax=Tritrichomonas foetus TaxID=1144522 RepID=A0A1J4JMK3_9EUKA|nr:hypothetical protein TRFO_08294 [Tritrichomonas foetus]|eukprot:OHS99663.1 hypothetical protein TRFO_08294 [Tritrichomonas foetus]